MRPLSANQPWGVFFVKFEPKRLPVVALRSILGRVTLKRRASPNDEDRPAWAKEDLLFISNYGEGHARQISFAHFAAPTGTSKLPTLKVLGWDGLDTALHLEYVGQELTSRLAWPDDEEAVDAWRDQWREAFTLGHREVITTAQMLAVHLAALARNTRDRISTVLQIEADNGRITRLMKSFRDALLHDLDAEDFADMVAQSLAYGLLSARITDPQSPGTGLAEHMRTNPLLRDLMSSFLSDQQTELDFDEMGVAEVVDLLDRANIDAVLRDFGDRNPREDPVIHFYESFLTEYDRQKKIQRGVFYTPRPVVSYIVKSVDAVLRNKFGLEDGLADVTSWAEMADRENFTIPNGISPSQDFVQILDPATGTGTFLVEVIDLIHRTLQTKWRARGFNPKHIESLWNEYVPQHLLPRLHGYELLMAPYAIAHLKIGLKLYETGYRFGGEARARVYLTNALEPAQSVSGLLDFAIPALAHEAQAVNEIKAMHRFTVILGNPPYAGHSANKNMWIRELLRGKVDNAAVENYFTVDGSPLNERNSKWLNDDYVKFLRLAHWQIERTGAGVVGFITNHSYLDNPTFRGMRQSLNATFPKIWLIDLHGSVKKREGSSIRGKDENVFDIQQGVAVSLLAKKNGLPRVVRHVDLWGTRAEKYRTLLEPKDDELTWEDLYPSKPFNLFIPQDGTLWQEYEQGWKITDIFPINVLGFQTHRDRFAVAHERGEIEYRVKDMLDTDKPDQVLEEKYRISNNRDWQISKARASLREVDDPLQGVIPCSYRPFDTRWCFFGHEFMDYPRQILMNHVARKKNICLLVPRQIGTSIWLHAFVADKPANDCLISNKSKEANYVFPAYWYPHLEGEETSQDPLMKKRVENLRPDFRSLMDTKFQHHYSPEEILGYIYAVLHSPSYRSRYLHYLKADFPRVPLAESSALFVSLSRVGVRLISVHLMEVESTDARVSFPVIGSGQVDSQRYTPPNGGQAGRVWINTDQYFDGVDHAAYAFAIGGYQPAEKWLKDRRGRMLSPDDVGHYCRIIPVLAETRRRMTEIDNIVDHYGGWPAAFQYGNNSCR